MTAKVKVSVLSLTLASKLLRLKLSYFRQRRKRERERDTVREKLHRVHHLQTKEREEEGCYAQTNHLQNKEREEEESYYTQTRIQSYAESTTLRLRRERERVTLLKPEFEATSPPPSD